MVLDLLAAAKSAKKDFGVIGVLDVFGFYIEEKSWRMTVATFP